jgi:NAD(P)H-nitrite reductase large subunit
MIFTNWKTAPPDTTVCYCNDIPLSVIKNAIGKGARTIADIQEMTGACLGTMCEEKNPSGGCCETDILKILAIFGDGTAPPPTGTGCNCCG